MDEKVYFRLSYETMTADTEDFINGCLERAGRADCNDPDAEIAWARSAIELWYHLAMAGRAPEDVADRDHLRLTGMLLRAPTAEQRSWGRFRLRAK
ncbi:hypothetical protein [Raoultella ornithinolytica]|uniref:hypothetical protein n=8 Tax=Klebsiella/Raoultella group TaxID=2890311 RepID=UPI001397618A|nr:hypothetical protein [Raoultella ornithinolytica]QHW72039.1 hypothetical protein GZS10_29730 [Raoultella ornithinolytica]